MEFGSDDFFGKLGVRLSFEILDRNEEDMVSIFILLTHGCEYGAVVDELRSVGLKVNCDGSSLLTGSIAIKNLKALAALPYVGLIDGSTRLYTC